jgi:hypothetical protein
MIYSLTGRFLKKFPKGGNLIGGARQVREAKVAFFPIISE